MQFPNEDGIDTWFLVAEDDNLAENYWAEVPTSGPYAWKVCMSPQAGIVLDNGEATSLEQAKHDAEQAWKRAVAN
ncbi:hypothetical protein AB5J62_33650 [Amycolatopsis sp. cg5]|uniref:hypothetical protein n=1 Tax=Amycolatopsis sp. cg5 TaxID=3238802 RepID=UPI00352498F0